MKICYTPKRFKAEALAVIDQANAICEEYEDDGYDLTLRQLYYQFVGRGLLENNDREYKRLGGIVNDARLAGLISWSHIEDRTRNLRQNSHWKNPQDILWGCASQFKLDEWEEQKVHVEVWVEKEALAGIVERVCDELDVAWFACRGYVSQSERHNAAERLNRYTVEENKGCVILHLGDHDPSGIDMTRDIENRLGVFSCFANVKRIALNMDQVRRYNPPPNPAKLTDSRCQDYIKKFGDESWELDALNPRTLTDLIRHWVLGLRDETIYDRVIEKEIAIRKALEKTALNFDWRNDA